MCIIVWLQHLASFQLSNKYNDEINREINPVLITTEQAKLMRRDHYNYSIAKHATMIFAHAQVLFYLKHSVWFQ